MTGNSGATRRGRVGLGGFVGLFFTLLVVELVLDIVLLPADEVLVPAELIGDALFFTAALVAAWVSSRKGQGPSGKQIGGRSRPALRGNRRAVTGSGVGIAVGALLFLAAVLAFEWWFEIHHPIISFLGLPFVILGDLVLGVLVLVAIAFGLTREPGPGSGRQLGP